ncbi:GPW/gp25 family protein [Microvirga sp. RSM25]|uniref:GPW/gp25 family protein n=1 Tax=Microvirga sp. RSM25 TaxID=3273802 RepID=UPI00384FF2B3
MSSYGFDRRTGKPMSGWDHVLQSLEVIFTTPLGSRVMRRTFGSAVPALLGRPINRATVLRFATAIIVAVELWEPRFRIRQISFARTQNTPDKLRLGGLSMQIVGQYRPRGHLGDVTPEGEDRTVSR